ncbi:homeobox protein vex1-like [Megalops cyprinoides]|uniref:homeobox protein vex1-like n=1 Tax=Megalops cyprinoides TaxID=118141 RepID=UPI001864C165|nr:homeobox protein vex1-like [Megalops cyprinoides]
MKGHFSVEWLSQSSRATCAADPKVPAVSQHKAKLRDPPTYSTPTKDLPGFTCTEREGNAEPQERPASQQQAQGQNTCITPHPGPDFVNLANAYSNVLAATDAGSSSSADEETSGYESEGGRSPPPAAPQDIAQTCAATGRRPRTAFTAQQINRLERAFKKHAYIGTHDKAKLCKKLSLSDKQIRNWFQNRRMKLKRTLQDTMAQACQTNLSSQLMHYPELQAFGCGFSG